MAGIVLILLSSLLYGVEPSILALALHAGVSAAEATAVYGLGITFCSLILVWVRRSPAKIPFRQFVKLLLLGAVGHGCTGILLSSAYQYIPVGCATMLHFMYPTFVCLLTALLFRSRLGVRRIVAILLSLSGLACIAMDSLGTSLIGIVLSIASSLTYSFYIIVLYKSEVSELRAETKMLYTSLGAFLLAFLVTAFQKPSGAINLQTGGIMAACGLMMFAAGLLFIVGLPLVGGTSASFLSLLEPITSLVLSSILYRYVLSATTIFGCALSVGAILMICLADRRDARIVRLR